MIDFPGSWSEWAAQWTRDDLEAGMAVVAGLTWGVVLTLLWMHTRRTQ